MVSPEQSKPLGVVPAVAYGTPTIDCAAATAAPAPAEPLLDGAAGAPAGAAPESPSAASVCGPTTPSTSRPCERWKALTAARVAGPNTPSALRPSFCCTCTVVALGGAVTAAWVRVALAPFRPREPEVCGPTM